MTDTNKAISILVSIGILVWLISSLSGLTQPSRPITLPEQKSEQKCHPSYSGCLRSDVSDYDCAGGSGNGPYYTGRVRVIGPDVFGLDRDGDGWGCE